MTALLLHRGITPDEVTMEQVTMYLKHFSEVSKMDAAMTPALFGGDNSAD